MLSDIITSWFLSWPQILLFDFVLGFNTTQTFSRFRNRGHQLLFCKVTGLLEIRQFGRRTLQADLHFISLDWKPIKAKALETWQRIVNWEKLQHPLEDELSISYYLTDLFFSLDNTWAYVKHTSRTLICFPLCTAVKTERTLMWEPGVARLCKWQCHGHCLFLSLAHKHRKHHTDQKETLLANEWKLFRKDGSHKHSPVLNRDLLSRVLWLCSEKTGMAQRLSLGSWAEK